MEASDFLKNVHSNDFFRKSTYKNDGSIFKRPPPPLFSGSEMATVISIDHVIFDWGPSSPLGVQG
jgi:hypothetical protein